MSNPNTAEEIVNLIMNGGATTKAEGRKNLQKWGIEMIQEHTTQTLDRLKEKVNNMYSVVDHPQRVKTIDEFIKLIEEETND